MSTWLSAALGDFHGYFVITPLVLSWIVYRDAVGELRPRWPLALIFICSFFLLFLSTLFFAWQAIYLLLPFGVFVALRFGMRGASLFSIATSICFTLALAQGLGPFVFDSAWLSFITLLIFVFSVGVPVLMLAAESGQLKKAQMVLEDKVRERTSELAIAKSSAEAANDSKSHFLAAASHDLRQPLHSMGLFIDSLEDSVQKGTHKPIIKKIAHCQEDLNLLLNELLDISRIDAGVVPVNKLGLPLQQLLSKLEGGYSIQAETKGLKFKIVSTKAKVYTDPLLLERMLRNLIENTVKYTDRGRILIGCRHTLEEVRIEVWDTGIGLDEKHQDAIFTEFLQLDNPERDRKKGLGLGLAIVRRLGELLKHPVAMFSLPGKGSCFSITLPRLQGDLAEQGEPLTKYQPALALDGMVILVIDNDHEILDAMGLILDSWGCRVLLCTGADQAIETISEQNLKPDLIISDYRLEEHVTGVQAINRVLQTFNLDCPAMLITGDTAPERIQEAADSGFPLLHKPLRPAQLRLAIVDLRDN